MVFISGEKQFYCIGRSFAGGKNDIYLCEDVSGDEKRKYILLAVKDHRVAKRLTEYFERGRSPAGLEVFSSSGMYCMAIPYCRERSLMEYISVERVSFERVKEICRAVVFACITSELPWPLLYIVLKSGYISIDKQDGIYFTYQLDLEMLREKNEADCVSFCADYLKGFLEKTGYTSWSGYRLLKMKNKRMNYRNFNDLYRDIYFGTEISSKKGFFHRVKLWFFKRKESILRVVKICCILVGFAALVFLITDMIFGESPFKRLFVDTMNHIGTESMLQ